MKPHETPRYGIREAARYLGIAPATLRSWVKGRIYPVKGGERFFPPVITLPDEDRNLLSFDNLVEAHVLWSLRNENSVPLRHVRTAMEYAQRELGIDRLLLHKEHLRTSAGELFLDKYNQLLNLSRSGQLAMRWLLELYLERVDWDEEECRPARIFPFTTADLTMLTSPAGSPSRLIAIDPTVRFGRPVLWRVGVSTSIVVDRIDAGEDAESVAADYGIEKNELEAILLFERAA